MAARPDKYSEEAISHFLQQLAVCPDHSLLEDKAGRIEAIGKHL
jgi:hypothetical protein